MSIGWRLSGGVFFSFFFHGVLLFLLLYHYPAAIQNIHQDWLKWVPFIENIPSESEFQENSFIEFKAEEKKTILVFPSIVLQDLPKKLKSEDPSLKLKQKKKKTKKPVVVKQVKKIEVKNKKTPGKSKSLDGILNQVGSYSGQLETAAPAEGNVSSTIGTLLSGLLPGLSETSNVSSPKLNQMSEQAFHQYKAELNAYLSQRWEVPIHMMENQDAVVVQFQIEKKGLIKKYAIEKKSGNKVLDESVSHLLKNLKLLPALPKSYSGRVYNFGVKFTPVNFMK